MEDTEQSTSLASLLQEPAPNTVTPRPDFSQPSIAAYLASLTTLALPNLEAEPSSLASSSAQLTNALTTLCHTSYPTFLSLHSTASTLNTSLSSLSSSLNSFLAVLPELESSARSFARETRDIQKDRHKASLVLEHHDKLYDVLSLPLLLDSCVRNHNYNEALLLSNHAISLSQRFPSNPIIQSVRAECDSRIQTMLTQLIGMLSEQAKLPALFRAVNFLRKMEVLDEQELALAFLTGRRVFLEGTLKAVETERKGVDGDKDRMKEAHAKYAKRYVDVWREGVYDVVTQYTTLFLDRAGSISPDIFGRLHALLTTFTTYHLQGLLELLKEVLPLIPEPPLLTSLLTQLSYCSNSFARIGMDFKELLSPIFVDAVKRGITHEFDDAFAKFSAEFSLPPSQKPQTSTPLTSAKSSAKKPSQFLVAQSAVSSLPTPSDAQIRSLASNAPNVPSQILVSYPPLALFTNAILSIFNSLRMLAPTELLHPLSEALDETLTKAASSLVDYSREKPWKRGANGKVDGEKEDSVVHACLEVFWRILVPFLRRGLVEGVYGAKVSSFEEGEGLRELRKEWEELSSRNR